MPPAALLRIRAKVQQILGGRSDDAKRIRRNRALKAKLGSSILVLRLVLLFVGYAWFFALPFIPELTQGTYIDENALQPAMVNTLWNWLDVQRADRILDQYERMQEQNSSSYDRASFAVREFQKLGLIAHTQNYTLHGPKGSFSGHNAYAISPSPRTSGSEAIVISASWLSCIDEGYGTPNMRGVASLLSLAAFLRQYSHWAKDLVFVISDGYMDGMHAWLSSYHKSPPQSNLIAEELLLSPGVIWIAMNIDYPGHSFSHLGAFHEGVNGRLPNQDLFNSIQLIARHSVGVPVVLYNHTNPEKMQPFWKQAMGAILPINSIQDAVSKSQNIDKHIHYQSKGRASGVHGVFHQYRIDAITLFAVPATGPHGFHAIGRIVESSLRTANNLLEQLHASFFFYILTGPNTFMKIGSYLPSAILISVSLMFGGLRGYVMSAWTRVPPSSEWTKQSRPVFHAILFIISTHIGGAASFLYLTLPGFSGVFVGMIGILIAGTIGACAASSPSARPIRSLLSSFNLCLISTIITVVSLLNFSLAASIALRLGLPLTLSSIIGSSPVNDALQSIVVVITAVGWLIGETSTYMREWALYGNWFAPFIWTVYLPLALQAVVAPYV